MRRQKKQLITSFEEYFQNASTVLLAYCSTLGATELAKQKRFIYKPPQLADLDFLTGKSLKDMDGKPGLELVNSI